MVFEKKNCNVPSFCYNNQRLYSLQTFINKKLSVHEDSQKLFYRGKLLEDGYKLFDYNVNLNDVIQMMIVQKSDDSDDTVKHNEENKDKAKETKEEEAERDIATSLCYEVGDRVDCLDRQYGAWFEAIILNIYRKDNDVLYNVKWEFNEDDGSFDTKEKGIRPRAYRILSFEDLDLGHKVMINYNIDEPDKDGFWYDLTIKKMRKTRTVEELIGTLHVGK